MKTSILLNYIGLWQKLARFPRKKDIPPSVQGIAIPVRFGIWGTWYCVRGSNGILTNDGAEMPFHEMRLNDGRVVIGQRDDSAADGTIFEEAWRDSRHAQMKTESTIEAAIARSISHNEIVKVDVTDIATALTEVNMHAEQYDHTDANEGEDVWGNVENGHEFRLLLVKA